MGFVPAGLVVFVQAGPFAWNGLLAFWLPIVDVFTWIVVMTVALLRAVSWQERDEQPSLSQASQ